MRKRLPAQVVMLLTCVAAAGCSGANQPTDSAPVLLQTAATARAVALERPTSTPISLVPGVARPPPLTAVSEAPPPSRASPTTDAPPPLRTAPTATPGRAPSPIAQPSPTNPPQAPTVAAPTPTAAVPTASPTAGTLFRKDRPIVYVAIGASDTVGVGAPDPARDGWVPQLLRHLPPGSKLLNLGISGARLSDALDKELPRALEAKPDFVTVWNIVNDLNANVDLAAYERDLDRLLADLVAKSGARVLIGNCPDLTRVPAYTKLAIPPDQLRAEVARWNLAIARSVGKQPNRVYLVDLYARSSELDFDPGLVSLDDFHPSARGYARVADVFWEFATAARLFSAG